MTSTAALPRDARLMALRPDAVTFRTREVLLPGTAVAFTLVLEGQPLVLQAPVEACFVVEKDKTGLVFDCRLDLTVLTSGDRQIVSLFIAKGRGSPELRSAS